MMNKQFTALNDYEELEYLRHSTDTGGDISENTVNNAPLMTRDAYRLAQELFPQRGVLGSLLRQNVHGLAKAPLDPRLYVNTKASWSAVVCGAQGSGKSHTVACLLETVLIQDKRIGNNIVPSSSIVFYYSEANGEKPCEAAYLSVPNVPSMPGSVVRNVTVLVSPSNLAAMTQLYSPMINVTILPLHLNESHLTPKHMLSLMGCDDGTTQSLYTNTALSVLRAMGSFSYSDFKERLKRSNFSLAQRAMIDQRISLLDSYVTQNAAAVTNLFGNDLVIVHLSDPLLNGSGAAMLFDIVLDLFMGWQTTRYKIIANPPEVLDEAHQYLTNNDSAPLTRSVSSLVRNQQHNAVKVVISTQEPTVITPSLMNLISFIICHKFSSPSWCICLKPYVSTGDHENLGEGWFQTVLQLRTGQAIVFCSGALTLANTPNPSKESLILMGLGYFQIETRPRLTWNGISSHAAPSARGVFGTESKQKNPFAVGLEPPSAASPNLRGMGPSQSRFFPLIMILEHCRDEGLEYPSRELIVQSLKSFPRALIGDKFTNFDEYLHASVEVGIVETGNDPVWDTPWYRLPLNSSSLPRPTMPTDAQAPPESVVSPPSSHIIPLPSPSPVVSSKKVPAWQGNSAAALLAAASRLPKNSPDRMTVPLPQTHITPVPSSLPLPKPKPVAPGTFSLLTKVLKDEEDPRPKLNHVAHLLKLQNLYYLSAAGFSKFKDYAIAAEAAGVVEIGGKFEDQGWMSLRQKR